jgi:hypothetical protein
MGEVTQELLLMDEIPPLGKWALLTRRIFIIGVLPAFSLGYLYEAMTIELPQRFLLISPRDFPTAVGTALVVATFLVAFLEVRKILFERRLAEGSSEGIHDDDRERITNWKDVFVTLGLLALYVASFSFLGFIISTFVFLVSVSTYLAPGRWVRNIVVSVFFVVCVYLLFDTLLSVRLPEWPLEGMF